MNKDTPRAAEIDEILERLADVAEVSRYAVECYNKKPSEHYDTISNAVDEAKTKLLAILDQQEATLVQRFEEIIGEDEQYIHVERRVTLQTSMDNRDIGTRNKLRAELRQALSNTRREK